MREILFRGKRLDNGDWVYGGYAEWGNVQSVIIQKGAYGENHAYEVDPSTVGQFTGLTDKNGVKIFEGDIVKLNDNLYKVVFEQRNGNAYFGWVRDELETWSFDADLLREMEVCGNIFDHPELLEEAQT